MIYRIIQAKYCPNLTELMLIALNLEIENLRSIFNYFSMKGDSRWRDLLVLNFFRIWEKSSMKGLKEDKAV